MMKPQVLIGVAELDKMVKEYSKTPDGKKKIKEYTDYLVDNDISKTEGGSTIISKKDMEEAAKNMIRILKDIASSKGLPDSVMKHFDSLDYTPPSKVETDRGTRHIVNVFFTDDLGRFSLLIGKGERKGQRTGEGIDNIVSLFDTGYSADGYAYGIWDSHSEAGIIRSREEREGLHFMMDAVDTFNSMYGEKYGVNAWIAADPKYYYRGGDSDIDE